MLRVLTLSTLFPDASQPTLGVFVERQTLGLAAHPDVELQVVAPVGLPPWPLSLHPHYARRARLPSSESWKGLTVARPRYPVFPRIGTRQTAERMAARLLPILRALRTRFPFDVIDAEFFWPDGPAAAILARELQVPCSIKARGADISFWARQPGIGEQIIAAARAADGLLAVSASLKADMVALGMPAEKIAVHYTGVDLDRFHPGDKAQGKASLGVSGPLIASVGALIPRKRQSLAIQALADIPGATLALAGNGPDRSSLEALARASGVAERVRFLGAIPHKDVANVLAAADVMLLPTRSEGLANAWVEALASGTPVVTSDIDPAREAIPPECGRLVPMTPAAIAAAVRELIDCPPETAVLRAAAERFSWDRNRDQLYGHLRAISRAA